jgi:hypothetical protein
MPVAAITEYLYGNVRDTAIQMEKGYKNALQSSSGEDEWRIITKLKQQIDEEKSR